MKISFGVISVIVGIVIVSLAVNQESNATFPGENGKIVFNSFRDGNLDIFTINPDGTEETKLTTFPGFDSGPSWSPDGKKIVFARSAGSSTDIWIMNPDGTGKKNLTNDPSLNPLNNHPSFSPDGTQIAFMSWRTGCCNIWTMNADGTNQSQLTHFSGTAEHPSWSPDGSKIAFQGATGGMGTDIFVINVDGTNLKRLTTDPLQDFNGSPDWSPDGNEIVFRSNRVFVSNDEIFVMNADGTNQKRITNNPSREQTPNWSPDGSKITFISNRDGNPDVFVMNADGTNQQNIVNKPEFFDSFPNWQPLVNNPPICEYSPINNSEIPSFGKGVVNTSSSSTTITNVDVSPFHKTVEVILSGITDVDGDPITLTIDSITQDEPVTGSGKGDKSPDGFGVGTDTAAIRSERLGTGDGRVYEISFTAEDENGGQCSSSRLVGVPHDNKKDPIDSGQFFDSTLP